MAKYIINGSSKGTGKVTVHGFTCARVQARRKHECRIPVEADSPEAAAEMVRDEDNGVNPIICECARR